LRVRLPIEPLELGRAPGDMLRDLQQPWRIVLADFNPGVVEVLDRVPLAGEDAGFFVVGATPNP
jgi:hypothetical protein